MLFELRPRQPLIGVALAAVLGIAVADRFSIDARWLLGASVVALLAVLLRPRTWTCLSLVLVAFASLHTLRHRCGDARRLADEFAGGPQVVRAVGIVWSEPEKPAFWSRTVTAHFRAKLESIDIAGHTERPDAIVNVAWAGDMPAYGDRVEFTATAKNHEHPRNPGEVDFAGYLERQGIFSECTARYAADCRVVDHGHGARAELLAIAARHWISERLDLDLADSPDIATLIESMVLGLRAETPVDEKTMFQRTGTMHLFAVSGLNVAMLAALAWFVMKPLGVPRRIAILLIVPMLAGYALITGLSASCVRATIMGAILLLSQLFDRPPVVYNSLAAAAVGILAWDTNQLFIPGFQFSFVLVIAIAALSSRIQRRCERVGRPDEFLPRLLWNWRQRWIAVSSGMLAGTLGVTLSAWIGSLFFTAGYFHLFSPSGILANLIAVPIAFAVLALGVATLVAAPLWKMGVVLLNNANWLFAKSLLFVVRVFALMPGGHVYVEVPRVETRPAVEITVLDLGDGGAAHLRAGGREWLFDCGSGPHYAQAVLPYLRSRGVNRLDGLLLTHGDVQHIGAASEVIADFTPRMIVDSPLADRSPTRRALHTTLAAKQLGKRIAGQGDTIAISNGTRLSVLYPPAGLARNLADDKALVVRLEHAGRRVLFMSDSGFATEQWLLEHEPDLRADLLVKGQHIKDFSGTADFIARVAPEAVICSAMKYGIPPATLDDWTRSLRAQGIAVFRQDECGAAQIEIRDGALNIRAFSNAQTFRSRAR